MAAEIKEKLGHDAELIRGSGGIFDVIVDGKKLFSKHDEHRFPQESEIIDTIRSKS